MPFLNIIVVENIRNEISYRELKRSKYIVFNGFPCLKKNRVKTIIFLIEKIAQNRLGIVYSILTVPERPKSSRLNPIIVTFQRLQKINNSLILFYLNDWYIFNF